MSLTPTTRLGRVLRADTTSGLLLVAAAAVALILANSPAGDWYTGLRDTATSIPLGPLSLHLSVGEWASDGLLAIFFFVVGLELKHEFVHGALSDVRTAITPMVAAAGGVVAPAVIFAVLIAAGGGEGMRGWAVPTATDIAFATAVLALVGRGLPRALTVFLLTLAVVDDLIAIVIIAVFYADSLAPLWILAAAVPALIFAWVSRRFEGALIHHKWLPWVVLLPLGALTWLFLHASGIHATIAGVALGLLAPASVSATRRRSTPELDGEEDLPLASVLAHRVGLLSSVICVPVFAFFAAGVHVSGGAAFGDHVVWGVILGLVIGKPLGILAATWLVTRSPLATLDPSLRWGHLVGVGLLGGIGFTVALLVSELAYGDGSPHAEHATLAVLIASVVAALAGAAWLMLLKRRTRTSAP